MVTLFQLWLTTTVFLLSTLRKCVAGKFASGRPLGLIPRLSVLWSKVGLQLLLRLNKNHSKKSRTSKKRGQGRGHKRSQAMVFTSGEFAKAYLLSRVNPFLSETLGVRAPDSFSYPTATAVIRNSFQFVGNAQGYAACVFLPDACKAAFNPASITIGGLITWSGGVGTSTAQANVLATLSTSYRVVSYGIRITTDASITNAAGHIWVANVAASYEYSPGTVLPPSEASYANLPLSEKFSLVQLAENPVIYVGRPIDDGIYRFRGSDVAGLVPGGLSPGALEDSNGWAWLALMGIGLPVGAAFNVETIAHIEYTQNPASVYGFVDAVTMPHDEQTLEAASRITQSVPVGIVENNIDTVAKTMDAVTNAIFSSGRLLSAVYAAGSYAKKIASPFTRRVGY